MKPLFLKLVNFLVDLVMNRLAKNLKDDPVYTYRRTNEQFSVGYWSRRGDFVEKAKTSTEIEAKQLVSELNAS